jgi:hypothetical protein
MKHLASWGEISIPRKETKNVVVKGNIHLIYLEIHLRKNTECFNRRTAVVIEYYGTKGLFVCAFLKADFQIFYSRYFCKRTLHRFCERHKVSRRFFKIILMNILSIKILKEFEIKWAVFADKIY